MKFHLRDFTPRFHPSCFFLLASALLLSACVTTRPGKVTYASPGIVQTPQAEVPVAPKRISTAKPPVATTRSLTVTESCYKDGKLKEREVVRKSEYKNGKLIKHQSVERAIVDSEEKIQ